MGTSEMYAEFLKQIAEAGSALEIDRSFFTDADALSPCPCFSIDMPEFQAEGQCWRTGYGACDHRGCCIHVLRGDVQVATRLKQLLDAMDWYGEWDLEIEGESMPDYAPLQTISGRLTRDLETKTTPGGKTVLSSAIARQDGTNQPTTFYDLDIWGEELQAAVQGQLYKGALVAVRGPVKERPGNSTTFRTISAWDVFLPLQIQKQEARDF